MRMHVPHAHAHACVRRVADAYAWSPQVEKQRIPIEVRQSKYEKDLEEMREGMLDSMGQEVDAAIQLLPPVFLQAELEEFRQRWVINEHPSGFKYSKNKLSTLQDLEIQNLDEIGKLTIGRRVDARVPPVAPRDRHAYAAPAICDRHL